MKCASVCVTLVASVTAQFALASPLISDSPLGCPPAKTITVPPSGEAEIVLAEGPQLISKRLGFPTVDQVNRWLDQLHDYTKIAKGGEPLSEEQSNKVIEHYKEYLNQAEPPEESLHWTLARRLGVLPSQVHRVLCEYRCNHKPE